MTLWWLSYADDKGFRGVVLIRATEFLEACALSRRQNLSPGGQVHGEPIDESVADLVPTDCIGVLLDRERVEALNERMMKLTTNN